MVSDGRVLSGKDRGCSGLIWDGSMGGGVMGGLVWFKKVNNGQFFSR